MGTGGFKANGQDENFQRIILQFMNDNCSCGYMSEESNYKAHRFSSWRASVQLAGAKEKKKAILLVELN